MKILFITKYPPIEGGASSRNYWLAKGLGNLGHEINLATNAMRVEEPYRESLDLLSADTIAEYCPKNVFIHSLKNKPPQHIPYSEAYLSRLVNSGLRIIEERGTDMIYAHYLEPYASAGFILKKITGLPLVIRHSGSDIHRILNNTDFELFLKKVLLEADGLIASKKMEEFASLIGIDKKKIIPVRRTAIDDNFFSSVGDLYKFPDRNNFSKSNAPLITYMGKAGEFKGIFELLNALEEINANFRLLLLTHGDYLPTIESRISSSHILSEKTLILKFIAPWEIPKILRASSILAHLENRFPVPFHLPMQPLEAVACGTPLLLSKDMFEKIKMRFLKTSSLFSVVDDPRDKKSLSKLIESMLRDINTKKQESIEVRSEWKLGNNWQEYLNWHIDIFSRIIRG